MLSADPLEQPRDTITVPQGTFIKAFLDPQSPTLLDPQKSAEVANHNSPTAYSLAQLKTKWFKEFAEESPLLKKAEQNIAEILDLSVTDFEHAQTVAKVSMFVAERLGKQRYSTRQELTAEDGKALIPKEEVELRLMNLRTKVIEQ